jgi:hypothetical protein
VNSSLPSIDVARQQLFEQMEEQYAKPDENYHQGDAPGAPMDFQARCGGGAPPHCRTQGLHYAED